MHIDIEPKNLIDLFQDIPLDKDYVNTFLFEQQGAKSPSVVQDEFFSSLPHLRVTNATYLRENRNSIVVPFKVGQIFNYNYMRFMNRSLIGEGESATLEDYFENKWYYAFIDSVEYKNNISCTIHYTIDVMQTWLVNLDYTFNYCFIKRQHDETDDYFKNLQPENLSLGDMIIATDYYDDSYHQKVKQLVPTLETTDDRYSTFLGAQWCVVFMFRSGFFADKIMQVISALSNNGYSLCSQPSMKNGIYQGLYFLSFPLNDETENMIQTVVTIVSGTSFAGLENVFIAPSAVCPLTPVKRDGESDEAFETRKDNYYNIMYHYNHSEDVSTFSPTNYFGLEHEYTALNNKLLTYPYQYISISNNRGDKRDYKFEFFTGISDFTIETNFSAQPSSMCYPTNYKGRVRNYDDKITVQTMPICSAAYSSFVDWLAKATMIGIGVATENVAVAGMGVASITDTQKTVTQTMTAQGPQTTTLTHTTKTPIEGEKESHKTKYNLSNGINFPNPFIQTLVQVSNGDILFGNDYTKMFTAINYQITPEYARKIDMYFSKFGYAINEVAIPNVSARPIFTYIETDDCVLKTNKLPHEAERQICSIIDKGITFWKGNNIMIDGTMITPLELIGNYSRDILEANVPD